MAAVILYRNCGNFVLPDAEEQHFGISVAEVDFNPVNNYESTLSSKVGQITDATIITAKKTLFQRLIAGLTKTKTK